MLLNPAKCQGYSFYHFWGIKGKPTRRGVKLPPPSRLGLSGKYSQKLLHHAKQSATDQLKTASKRAIQKIA